MKFKKIEELRHDEMMIFIVTTAVVSIMFLCALPLIFGPIAIFVALFFYWLIVMFFIFRKK